MTFFVSVVVPVRNGEKKIANLLRALLMQDYPKSHTEIIIVDNGSRDRTQETVKKYPVILGIEDTVISSYAARNRGLSMARGEIIAFTDADCIPERSWISEGVRTLQEENADMAGGRVKFDLPARMSAAEFVDSMNFLDNEQHIKNRRGAITANLFVRSHLFEQAGFFPAVRSGGDIRWTGRALQEGFSLIYAPQAVVRHPLRNFEDLIRKSWRVGRGMGCDGTAHARNKRAEKICLMLRLAVPLPRQNIRDAIFGKTGRNETIDKRLAIWLVSYLCQLSMLTGMLGSVFRKSQATANVRG